MPTFEDFVCKVLLENMLMLLRKDISIGKGSQRHEGYHHYRKRFCWGFRLLWVEFFNFAEEDPK